MGKLNRALAAAREEDWLRVDAVARSTQSWAKPVERPGTDRDAWTAAAVARRHAVRAKQRARLGRERLKAMWKAIAKRGELWRAGAISQVLRPMLRGRHTGSLVTVTTADGRLHVRPGKVHLARCDSTFDSTSKQCSITRDRRNGSKTVRRINACFGMTRWGGRFGNEWCGRVPVHRIIPA